MAEFIKTLGLIWLYIISILCVLFTYAFIATVDYPLNDPSRRRILGIIMIIAWVTIPIIWAIEISFAGVK